MACKRSAVRSRLAPPFCLRGAARQPTAQVAVRGISQMVEVRGQSSNRNLRGGLAGGTAQISPSPFCLRGAARQPTAQVAVRGISSHLHHFVCAVPPANPPRRLRFEDCPLTSTICLRGGARQPFSWSDCAEFTLSGDRWDAPIADRRVHREHALRNASD